MSMSICLFTQYLGCVILLFLMLPSNQIINYLPFDL